MSILQRVTLNLVKASKGNPVISTTTILLFYLMFNFLEALIERLIFGERFEHWMDPFFMVAFITYSAYTVWGCAIFNNRLLDRRD